MIVIRKLRNTDKPAFSKVYSETIKNGFPEYSKKTLYYFASKKYQDRMFAAQIKFGAFEKGNLAGYLLAEKPIGGVVYIYWFAVLQEHQGRGVGTALLKRLEKTALKNGAHNIQFHSDKRNVKYYKSRGYEVVGLDKKSYFGTDNYIIKKIIQEPKEKNFLK